MSCPGEELDRHFGRAEGHLLHHTSSSSLPGRLPKASPRFLLPSSPLTPLLLDVEFQEAPPAMLGAMGRFVGLTIGGAEPKKKDPPTEFQAVDNHGKNPMVFPSSRSPLGVPARAHMDPPCETTSPSPSTCISQRGGTAQRMSNCHQIGIFGAD